MRKIVLLGASVIALAALTASASALSIGVNSSQSSGFGAVGFGGAVSGSQGSSNSASTVVFHNGTANAGGSYGSTGNASAVVSVPFAGVGLSTGASANGTSTTGATRN